MLKDSQTPRDLEVRDEVELFEEISVEEIRNRRELFNHAWDLSYSSNSSLPS